MALQIQLRRGLAAQWTLVNPILAQGELAVESDTRRFKVGDGVTVWNQLEYTSETHLEDLYDVLAANPEDGDLLIYDNDINKWVSQKDLDKQRIDGGHY
jgi:hypothetical protein